MTTQAVALDDAVPIHSTSKSLLPYTRINQDHISTRQESAGQSIYKCLFNKMCGHRSANQAQIANHLRRMDVGTCIACRLCPKCFWAGNGFKAHIKSVHSDQPNQWYEPVANLGELKLEPASQIK